TRRPHRADRHRPHRRKGLTMWTVEFWRATGERALKTLVQALIALLGGGVGILDIEWGTAWAGIASMVILSVLTSLASALSGDKDSPSLVRESAREPVPRR